MSVIVSVPLREPVTEGVKVTPMLQVTPPARLDPQLLLWAKSALAAILDMLRV